MPQVKQLLLLEPHGMHLIQLVALAGLLDGGLSWSLFMPFLVSSPRSPFTCLTSLGLTILRLLPPQFPVLPSPPEASSKERCGEFWDNEMSIHFASNRWRHQACQTPCPPQGMCAS